MRKRTVGGLIALACIMTSAEIAWSADAGLDLINDFIAKALQTIQSWENKALYAELIAVAIVILGLITGALQKIETSWTKGVTATCGLLIGCLTVVGNMVFDHDHRQFRSMAHDAQTLVDEIKLIRSLYASANPDNQRSMLEDVAVKNRRILQLEQTQKSERQAGLSLIPVAFAGGQPRWVTHVPSDKDNYYFVGVSDNRSYESAKQASKENALEEATSFFVSLFGKSPQQIQVDNESLSGYLVKSAQVRETHFEYDTRSTTYRYYTLVRVNKQIANTDLRLFSVGKNTSVPTGYSQTLKQTQREPNDYLARRLDSWTKSLDTARQSLSPDQYAKFIKARELRNKSQYDEAIALLLDLIRERDGFYLGWYNLARNYDDKQNFAAAQRAYDRAVRLEPKQPTRDASLYNSYGFFLYRHKNYADSIRYLNLALEIDPSHPSAAKTLQAAQKATR